MGEGQTSPFRVIVAGGGLVGLNAAHILSSLSAAVAASNPDAPALDFVILEQHESVTPHIGSLLALWSPVYRVYDQLGLLSDLKKIQDKVEGITYFNPETGVIDYEDKFPLLHGSNHGYYIENLHRPDFANFIYNHLSESDKARVLLNKKIVNVEADEHGVTVHCQDGTVEEGDILIGADGVRSCVRDYMRTFSGAAAAAAEKQARAGKEEVPPKGQTFPYVASYRMMFGSMPPQPDMAPGFLWDGASTGLSTQLVTGSDKGAKRTWWAIFDKLDKPTDVRTRYTEADKKALIDRCAHLYVGEGMTVADAVKKTDVDIGLLNLEEGSIDDWYWKRIVLVGDAVRKLTPNAGLGFNSGLSDLATLSNRLYRLLLAQRHGQSPSLESIDAAFSDYQATRKRDAFLIDNFSRQRTRQVAWGGVWDRINHFWVLPYTPIKPFVNRFILAPLVSKTEVLEWLVENNLGPHSIPYIANGLPVRRPAKEANTVGVASSAIYYSSLVLGLASIALFGFKHFNTYTPVTGLFA